MKVVLVLLVIAGVAITTLAVGIAIGYSWPDENSENESIFYWGWLASCIKSGQDAGVDQSLVLAYCDEHMRWAYERDLFGKLDTDKWTWPPEPVQAPSTGN